MESIILACALLEEMLPGYRFSPRWLVRYGPGDAEYARGGRFLAMGVPGDGVGESVFVLGLVTASQVRRGRVELDGPSPAGLLTLSPAPRSPDAAGYPRPTPRASATRLM